ncbi:MAG: GGDEF domain-containing protein [Gammaproteobacteria bacterium]|nr:GGDEF domain-containing protein [Gammaproteobacteria bacterium]
MDNIDQYINPTAAREQLGIAPAELQQTLKLAGLLQTSLEIDSVLNFFLQSAQQIVNFDAAHFSFEEQKLNLKYGKTQRHRCSYRLRLAGEFLGELVFTRRRRFAEQEMEHLENLMGQLIYPLRNAIWYQRALQTAKIDNLTGAHNRAALDETLEREIELAHRHQTALSIIMFDLDHFKQINDNYGHMIGDDVLRECVKCCEQALRGTDMLFRFGGEEFTIVLPGVNANGASLAAERIRGVIEKHVFNSRQGSVPVTISVGTASVTLQDTAEIIIERADKGLYLAKNAGRNRVACAEESPEATAVNA